MTIANPVSTFRRGPVACCEAYKPVAIGAEVVGWSSRTRLREIASELSPMCLTLPLRRRRRRVQSRIPASVYGGVIV